MERREKNMVIKFGNKLGPGAMVCLQFYIEEVRSGSVVVLSVCRYLSFRKGDCISGPIFSESHTIFSLLKFSWVRKRCLTIQSRKAILRTSTFPASGCDGYIPVQCLLDMARRRSRRHIDIHRNSSVPCSSRISHMDCGLWSDPMIFLGIK